MSDPATVRGLLDLLGEIEAKGNYNAVIGNAQATTDLSNMTIAEVRAYQNQLGGSKAIGRYQIIPKTFDGLIAKGVVSQNDKFTPDVQDKLAVELMRQRGLDRYLNGSLSPEAFTNNLAKEWAAVPVATDVVRRNADGTTTQIKAGQSYYDGVAGNSARTNTQTVLTALADIKNPPTNAVDAITAATGGAASGNPFPLLSAYAGLPTNDSFSAGSASAPSTRSISSAPTTSGGSISNFPGLNAPGLYSLRDLPTGQQVYQDSSLPLDQRYPPTDVFPSGFSPRVYGNPIDTQVSAALTPRTEANIPADPRRTLYSAQNDPAFPVSPGYLPNTWATRPNTVATRPTNLTSQLNPDPLSTNPGFKRNQPAGSGSNISPTGTLSLPTWDQFKNWASGGTSTTSTAPKTLNDYKTIFNGPTTQPSNVFNPSVNDVTTSYGRYIPAPKSGVNDVTTSYGRTLPTPKNSVSTTKDPIYTSPNSAWPSFGGVAEYNAIRSLGPAPVGVTGNRVTPAVTAAPRIGGAVNDVTAYGRSTLPAPSTSSGPTTRVVPTYKVDSQGNVIFPGTTAAPTVPSYMGGNNWVNPGGFYSAPAPLTPNASTGTVPGVTGAPASNPAPRRQSSPSYTPPPPPPVTFRGTSTGNTYVAGNTYTRGGNSYTANKDGTFTNNSTGHVSAGSSGYKYPGLIEAGAYN